MVVEVERRVGAGEVGAAMDPARFAPGERRCGDQPGERVGVVEQAGQALGVAHRPGQLPDRLSRLGRRRRELGIGLGDGRGARRR